MSIHSKARVLTVAGFAFSLFTSVPLRGQGCTQQGFLGGITTPVTVSPGASYQLSCDYGAVYGYIFGNNCNSFAGFNGTQAVFNCTAPSSPGYYQQTCQLGTGPTQNFCARNNDPAGTLTVQYPGFSSPPWSNQDVGAPPITGSAVGNGAAFTVNGSGQYVFFGSDAFQYLQQSISGDFTVIARLSSFQLGSGTSKAGIMIQNPIGNLSSAQNIFFAAHGGGNTVLQARSANGGNTDLLAWGVSWSYYNWLKLARLGSTLTASYSNDGQHWSTLTSTSIAFPQQVSVGLAVTAEYANSFPTLASGVFDNVSVTVPTLTPPPSPWTSQDIGSTGTAGTTSYNNGTFAITGSGSWIWYTQDSFQFVSQPVPGNATLIAHLASFVPLAGGTSKAGLMFRDGTDPSAANVLLTAHGNGYLEMQYRSSYGNSSSVAFGPLWASNPWLKLVRSGNTFTGYTSPDSVNWTLLNSVSVPMVSVIGGLAVGAESYGSTASAAFDNVSMNLSAPTYTIQGQITASGSGLAGVSVALSGGQTGTTTTDVNGNYSFTVAAGGSYTATPVKAGFSFSPPSGTSTNVTANVVLSFQAVGGPSITSVSPPSGAIGVPVTISGLNFGAVQGPSLVKFNGVAATPTRWSDTTIVVPVPPGSTAGNLSITVGNLSSGSWNFTIDPATVQLLVTGSQSGTTYQIGDSFALSVYGPPNQPVSVYQNGQLSGTLGTTNQQGVWSTTATWGLSDVGDYTQTWYVAGVASIPGLSFQVSSTGLPLSCGFFVGLGDFSPTGAQSIGYKASGASRVLLNVSGANVNPYTNSVDMVRTIGGWAAQVNMTPLLGAYSVTAVLTPATGAPLTCKKDFFSVVLPSPNPAPQMNCASMTGTWKDSVGDPRETVGTWTLTDVGGAIKGNETSTVCGTPVRWDVSGNYASSTQSFSLAASAGNPPSVLCPDGFNWLAGDHSISGGNNSIGPPYTCGRASHLNFTRGDGGVIANQTLSVAERVPSGETSSFRSWADGYGRPTTAIFDMQLTVKQGDPAYDFGGRFVKQVDPYQGDILPSGFSPSDGCYWGNAPWPAPITSLDTPGLTWFVQSGPNGSYGPDYIGLNATFVGWIQNYAPAIQSAGSCKIQFPQKMLVSVDGGVVATETYGGPQSGLNLLVFTYTPTTVQVSRGSATGTRSFNY